MSSIGTPIEVQRVQVASQNALTQTGQETILGQQGKSAVTQESVKVSAAKADTTDALEELGMSAATLGRSKSDLDKMKLRRGQGANFEALGRIAEYYDKLPSMPTGDKRRNLLLLFKQLENFLRLTESQPQGSGGAMPTADDIRKMLADFDGDVAHQFAILENIRERAGIESAPQDWLDLLDTVRADFRQPEVARDVLAGFASGHEANEIANRIGVDPTEYRDSYRTLLRESPRLGGVFDELRKFSLTQNFNEVIDSFVKVAGNDIGSFSPSTDPVILGDVIRELTVLRQMRTVLDKAVTMSGLLDRMYPTEGSTRPNGEEIASRLLNFASATVATASDAEGLVAGYEPQRFEVPVAAINMLRDLHAALPDTVIQTPQAREQQGKLLLALSDRLVAADEDAYGN